MRSYSFNRPLTASGKPTRYISVLSLLNRLGPTNRYEILQTVWGIKNATTNKNLYRGHMSDLFAAMRNADLVKYDTKTYKWSITDRGHQVLEDAKYEWGKRYAENYWG